MPKGRLVFASLCFLLSGASALIYQIVWLKQLGLVVGTTTAAVSTVLAVFMAGLGLGARYLGGLADRSGSPLRLYACLELGIALYALALPRLLDAAGPAYVALARGATGSPATLLSLRIALGFGLLLLPTLMMGATLPVLVRYVAGGARRFGRDLGTLYAVNLWGAVAGCVVTGFVLIRFLGVRGATLAAVLTNLVVALLALVRSSLDRTAGSASLEAPGPEEPTADPSEISRAALWGVVLASGFVTMAFEVLWTRILVFPFQSTVYAFTIILATFLAGLALGSGLYARLESRVPPLTLLALAQLGAGLTALLLAPVAGRPQALIDAFSNWLGFSGGVFLAAMALCSALAMLLPATLMGVVFPLGTRLLAGELARAGRSIGGAYLVNTVGSVAGSLTTGFLLIPALGLKTCLLGLCAGQALLGALFLTYCELPRRRRLRLLAGALAGLVVAVWAPLRVLRGLSPFDAVEREHPGAVIEAHRDDATASVSVVRDPNGSRTLRIDGFDATGDDVPGGYMPMMTHVPLLLHPDPGRMLVICFGAGRTAGAGLLHPGARIDVVDINRAVFGFARFFREANHAVAESPRARLIPDDGRNFLLTTRERYDVITQEPMPPRFAGVVNFYTREYYALARERLRPGGVVVQWLPMHLLTLEESLRIVRTALDVFPETSLWLHSSTGILVSRAGGPLSVDVGMLQGRLARPEIAAALAAVGVNGLQGFTNLYGLGPTALARLTERVRPITDDLPALEFHPPRHRWVQTDLWLCLELFFRLRRGNPPPLTGGGPALLADLREGHAASSFALLGELYASLDQFDKARAEYAAGAAHAKRPQDRALFLFAQAQLAQAEGDGHGARRLLDEGLVLDPTNRPALDLRRQLGGS
ncbi:MAG TPA: fused MFS/spermidine synthase [Vicinamibacteria bacterium]|nr:fused MFS/spermidine synthase [Vicinamibacteria bacterium]